MGYLKKDIPRVIGVGLLALCLVSTARAQNYVYSLNAGVTRIKTAGAIPTSQVTFRLLTPANASQVVIDFENPLGGPTTYTVTFQEDNLESTGVGPALACVRLDFNKQLPGNSSGSFASVALASVSQRYACPVPSVHRILINLFATSAGTDSTTIYAIVDSAQTYQLPAQSPSGNSYTHISTATSTIIKSTSGVLHSLTINTTVASAVTVFDNTACSGTTIAVLAASAAQGTYTYDVVFTTGLCVLTAGASDITVSAR